MEIPFPSVFWINSNDEEFDVIWNGDSGNGFSKFDVTNHQMRWSYSDSVILISPFETSAAEVLNSTWQMLTITRKGTGLNLYLNGKLLSQTTSSDGWTPRNKTVLFENFSGSLDNLRTYNRLLTASEVQELYDAEKSVN